MEIHILATQPNCMGICPYIRLFDSKMRLPCESGIGSRIIEGQENFVIVAGEGE